MPGTGEVPPHGQDWPSRHTPDWPSRRTRFAQFARWGSRFARDNNLGVNPGMPGGG